VISSNFDIRKHVTNQVKIGQNTKVLNFLPNHVFQGSIALQIGMSYVTYCKDDVYKLLLLV
jgi:hypothetical protein